MRILLLAAGNRQPDWVTAGYQEYARRLRGRSRLTLREIPLARGRRAGAASTAATEGRRMLDAVPKGAHVVALSVDGRPWSTAELALRLERWLGLGVPLCLLLGGPDGLDEACLERAAERWSLSPLTLPHGLARVVVAEALYRAFSVIEGHPYHRG